MACVTKSSNPVHGVLRYRPTAYTCSVGCVGCENKTGRAQRTKDGSAMSQRDTQLATVCLHGSVLIVARARSDTQSSRPFFEMAIGLCFFQ